MTTVVANVPAPDGRFYLRELIPLARSRIKGTKGVVFLLAVASVILSVPIAFLFPASEGLVASRPGEFAGQALQSLVCIPFGIAFAAIGLQRYAGQPVRVKIALEHLHAFPGFLLIVAVNYLIAYVLASLLGIVGLVLALLFASALGFAAYYILDRGLTPFPAMRASLSLFWRNLGQMVLYLLLVLALMVLGMLTLGIGFIWLFPFMYIVHAAMYASAEGLGRFAMSMDSGDY
jgi:hypothetical protein